MERIRDVGPGVIVYLTFAVISLGGCGETKHGMKRLHSAPLIHADIQSHLSGSSVIQPFAASEERWHPRYHHHHHYYNYSNNCSVSIVSASHLFCVNLGLIRRPYVFLGPII